MSSNIEAQEARPASRKARKAATRRSLLAAAERCFADKGYVSTQIGDIAKAAGVAHGTFYVHFPNKEALLEKLLEQFNEGLLERLTALQAVAPRPADPGTDGLAPHLRPVAHTFLAYWSEGRDFVRAYAEKAALGTSIESLRDGINPQMVGFLSQALTATKALPMGTHRVELVTHGLLALWMRIGMQALFNDEVSLTEAEDTLVMMTVGVFSALGDTTTSG
jgi:AcrR family transcriptional regulator